MGLSKTPGGACPDRFTMRVSFCMGISRAGRDYNRYLCGAPPGSIPRVFAPTLQEESIFI